MRLLRNPTVVGACVACLVVGEMLIGPGVDPAGAITTSVSCATSSLQTAINNAPAGSTIRVSGTCSGQFTIDDQLTLQGAATLNGDGGGPVLTVDDASVNLTNLTIENGRTGGGIDNEDGQVTLTSSVVSGNAEADGGGIYNGDGTLILVSSNVSGNSAVLGGGIYNYLGQVTIISSTVLANTASIAGGGIYNFGGGLTITSSDVWLNHAGSFGGGIWSSGTVIGSSTSSVILNSTGGSDESGGGIYGDRATYEPDGLVVELNWPDNVYLAANPCVTGVASVVVPAC